MSGSGAKLSIPSTTRKMIQNIKEITGNHSEEEIYAMLKECSMDPNETTQKLLFQDTFHVVKRKRDKRKDNVGNKESGDIRWKSGNQGRGGRSLRVNFPPRFTSHDASGSKNSGTGRDSGNNQTAEKGAGCLLPASYDKSKETTQAASSTDVVANGSSTVTSESQCTVNSTSSPAGGGANPEVISPTIGADKLRNTMSLLQADNTLTVGLEIEETCGVPMTSSSNSLVPVTPASSATVCFSPSDPVLVPSNDLRLPGAVGAIKREVGSHRTVGESTTVVPTEKSALDIGAPFLQRKISSKSHGVGKSQLSETSPPSSTSGNSGSSGSRPSSNYSNRAQQIVGSQRAGPNKEWKPKPTGCNLPQGSGTVGSSDLPNNPVEGSGNSQTAAGILDSEDSTYKLQKKLEMLHLPPRQHVIIPNHIHVPESERTKLSFGSFDGTFEITSSAISAPASDKSSSPKSETSYITEENAEEQATRQSALMTAEEGAYPNHPHSPSHPPENFSVESDVPSNTVSDYNEAKPETALFSGGHQYSVVHTSPNYSFGLVPPMLGSQIAPFENSESQMREVSRLPSFVVQQPFDPASYYAQFYRSGADTDGRVSPFPSPGIAPKYNGNVAVLPPHTAQSPQEAGNSLVLSTVGQTPLVTQTAGLMQSSIAVTQQPVPVFRPPTGLHISHYPPNYISYGHFFSPFYVPPPGIHQFLSNGAFPQQPQAGSVYPAPPTAAATGVKYSLPQYKPVTNTGNSTQFGMPSGYGPYGSSPAGYNPSSASTGGNSTTNEDLNASQFKESNVYMTGQQSEGSAVWIAAAGRDMSNLPTSSFYNLPPQGQHVAFTPTQSGHGTFASIYHPAATASAAVHPLLQQTQAMAGAVDMVGPASNVYQQPQHQQVNWPSNY